MGLRIPPLKINIILESHPLKSRILVWRLAVSDTDAEARKVFSMRSLTRLAETKTRLAQNTLTLTITLNIR